VLLRMNGMILDWCLFELIIRLLLLRHNGRYGPLRLVIVVDAGTNGQNDCAISSLVAGYRYLV
jgi:hypothetical protein